MGKEASAQIQALKSQLALDATEQVFTRGLHSIQSCTEVMLNAHLKN